MPLDDIAMRIVVRDDGTVVLERFRAAHAGTAAGVGAGNAAMAKSAVSLRERWNTAVPGLGTMALELAQKVERMAKMATIAFIGIGVASIKMAADFEKGMAEVFTIIGKGNANFEDMSDAVLDLSARMGEGTKTLVKGLYDTVSSGIEASKAMGFLETAAKAAVAGVTTTAKTVDVLTTMVNAYGLKAEDAMMVSDKLFMTVLYGKTTMEELSGAMGRAAPMAANLGVSMDELLAALAGLTITGVDTNTAITSLRGVMSALIKPTADSVEVAKKYGIELTAASLSTKGFVGFIRDLREKLMAAGLSTREMAEAFGLLFPDVRAVTAVMGLGGEAFSRFEEIQRGVIASSGATERAFATMSDTMSFKMGQMKQAWAVAMKKFGEELIPKVKPIVEHLAKYGQQYFDILMSLGKAWLGTLGDAIKALTDVGGGLEGTAKKAGGVKEALELVLQALRGMFLFVNGVRTEVGYLVAAFQAVGAIIFTVITVLGLLVSAVVRIGETIVGVIGGAFEQVGNTARFVFYGAIEVILKLVDNVRQGLFDLLEMLNEIDIAGVIPDTAVKALRGELPGLTEARAGRVAAEKKITEGPDPLEAARVSWRNFTKDVAEMTGIVGNMWLNATNTWKESTKSSVERLSEFDKILAQVREGIKTFGEGTKSAMAIAIGELDKEIEKTKAVVEAEKQRGNTMDLTIGKLGELTGKSVDNLKVMTDAEEGALFSTANSLSIHGGLMTATEKVGGEERLSYAASTARGWVKITKDMYDALTGVLVLRKKEDQAITDVAAIKIKAAEAKTAEERLKILTDARDSMLKEQERTEKGLTSSMERIRGQIGGMAEATKTHADTIAQAATTTANATTRISSALREAVDAVGGIRELQKEAAHIVSSLSLAAAGAYQHGGLVSMQGGGQIGEGIPIIAHQGEYVVQRPAVEAYGTALLDAINAKAYQPTTPGRQGAEDRNLQVDVVVAPTEDFTEQFVSRARDAIFALLANEPKRVRKILKLE